MSIALRADARTKQRPGLRELVSDGGETGPTQPDPLRKSCYSCVANIKPPP
jgi:hypothetical protein